MTGISSLDTEKQAKKFLPLRYLVARKRDGQSKEKKAEYKYQYIFGRGQFSEQYNSKYFKYRFEYIICIRATTLENGTYLLMIHIEGIKPSQSRSSYSIIVNIYCPFPLDIHMTNLQKSGQTHPLLKKRTKKRRTFLEKVYQSCIIKAYTQYHAIQKDKMKRLEMDKKNEVESPNKTVNKIQMPQSELEIFDEVELKLEKKKFEKKGKKEKMEQKISEVKDTGKILDFSTFKITDMSNMPNGSKDLKIMQYFLKKEGTYLQYFENRSKDKR